MGYTQEDCLRDTKEHITQVRKFMLMFAEELTQRALVHDQSKLKSPELEIFTEYTPKLKESTYGSREYKEFLKEMKVALKHHYSNNSHHPEHYTKYVCNGCFSEYNEKPDKCYGCGYSQLQEESDIAQMDLADIVEMICDWKAATLRHNDGDIRESIDINKDRFKYSDDLHEIFHNTVKMFD
ncbi:MAG: DUF5662 family protein [Candidatus Paceibacterota bacterium]